MHRAPEHDLPQPPHEAAPDPPPQPPREPDLDDCCGQGCDPCVFDLYDAARERHRAALESWRQRRSRHTLRTPRATLEPLVAAHADAMFDLLRDPALYAYLDEAPPDSAAGLRERYARLESRASPDGRERWLNWVIRLARDGSAAGFVQATVRPDGSAWVAFVVGRAFQRRGLATEAMRAMLDELAGAYGVGTFLATAARANAASIALLERLGFAVADAEQHRLHRVAAGDVLLASRR